MPQTIVLAFSTLDGIIEDPDGSGGTPRGGWAFRDGPVAPDHFRLGPKLDTGVLLLGRKPGSCSRTSGPAGPMTFPSP